jgi:hypothetical protein
MANYSRNIYTIKLHLAQLSKKKLTIFLRHINCYLNQMDPGSCVRELTIAPANLSNFNLILSRIYLRMYGVIIIKSLKSSFPYKEK